MNTEEGESGTGKTNQDKTAENLNFSVLFVNSKYKFSIKKDVNFIPPSLAH